MGKKQTIKLPAAMDKNAPDKDDKDNLNIIRNKEINILKDSSTRSVEQE
jgi:hypothetical protein